MAEQTHDETLVSLLMLIAASSEVDIQKLAENAVMVLKGFGLGDGIRTTSVHDHILQSLTYLSHVNGLMRIGK